MLVTSAATNAFRAGLIPNGHATVQGADALLYSEAMHNGGFAPYYAAFINPIKADPGPGELITLLNGSIKRMGQYANEIEIGLASRSGFGG